MFQFSAKSRKRWLVLGCFFLFLTTAAFVTCSNDPLFNVYTAELSASSGTIPSPLNEAGLRPGDLFYIFVYSRPSTYPDDQYEEQRYYTLGVEGATLLATSRPCENLQAQSVFCTPGVSKIVGRLLINVITARVNEDLPPGQNWVRVLGVTTKPDGSYVETFLESRITVQRGQLEVTYLGAPVAHNATVELSEGSNPFEVWNVSPGAIQITAYSPQLTINPVISVERLFFPTGAITLQPGDSDVFVLRCIPGGGGNLELLTMQNTSSIPLYRLWLLCDPPPLPALRNQPENGGGGQIIVVTAEPPQPTEEAPPIATEPPVIATEPPVDCQADPDHPNC
jgi:hypothetical protein